MILAALALLAVGYALGRYQPCRRASDWANWEVYRPQRPTGLRFAALWTVLSTENLAWLALHPRQGWHAWQHRNDPPPPRSPAVRINENWVAERQAAAKEQK